MERLDDDGLEQSIMLERHKVIILASTKFVLYVLLAEGTINESMPLKEVLKVLEDETGGISVRDFTSDIRLKQL